MKCAAGFCGHCQSGPMEAPNTGALATRLTGLGSTGDEIIRAFRRFKTGAEAFRRQSEAHEGRLQAEHARRRTGK